MLWTCSGVRVIHITPEVLKDDLKFSSVLCPDLFLDSISHGIYQKTMSSITKHIWEILHLLDS
jgi:hypothetical protein